jgi:hypothetical protein
MAQLWHADRRMMSAVAQPVEPVARPSSAPDRGDLIAVILLSLLAGAAIWTLQSSADPRFLMAPAGNDVWFEADQPTVADRMLHRWSDQSRNARHALFPMMATLPVYVFTTLGLQEAVSLRLVVVTFGILWTAVLYLLLRSITAARSDALVFTALGHASAAAMFWVPIPETYALGSVSVMAMLALCGWDPGGRRASAWYVAAAAFSLSVITTNWLTGFAGIVTRRRWRAALQIAANSLVVVVVLWAFQHVMFPTADFFLGSGVQHRYILPRGISGVPAVLRTMFVHAMVMPDIRVVAEPKWGTIMSVQQAAIGSSGLLGAAATVVWAALFVLGAWTLVTRAHAMRAPLALALSGHLLVYAVYGEETFLYSLLVVPLLIAIAAQATHTRLRPIVTPLAVGLTIVVAANNWTQFTRARGFFESRAAPAIAGSSDRVLPTPSYR